MTPSIGSTVLFWSGGALGLGLVVAEEKQRLRVARAAGGDERITTGRVAQIVARPAGAGEPSREALAALEREIREAAEGVDVEVLWSLVIEEPGASRRDGIDLERLGPLAVEGAAPGVACAATLIAIRDERLHFERKGERWLPRSPESVAALREERRRVAERERETCALHDALASAVREGAGRLPAGPAAERALQALRALALDDEAVDGAPRREGLDALRASGLTFERPGEGAFRLLRLFDVWPHDDANLQPERFGLRVGFPDGLLELGVRRAAAAARPAPGVERVDLTGLPTLSIDGSRTREIDDAVSVGSDGRVWIHIADPSAVLEPGDPIDGEALRRGLSHYMPDLRLPMLPPALCEDALGLVAGTVRPALSVGVRLGADGAVANAELVRSLVRCNARLTYAEADALVAGPSDADAGPVAATLRSLAPFAEARREARHRDGALLLDAPDVDLHVAAGGEIELERLEPDSVSRAIVSEAMVLVGALCAERCRDAGVPVFYRGQAAPAGRAGAAGETLSGVLEVYRRRRTLRRAEVSLRPMRHASLGVDAYCQATSPLRRYQDLVCHRQLIAAIAGTAPPYDDDELGRLLVATREAEQVARRAEAAARGYWRLRWLQRQADRRLEATVVESGPRARVLLDALQTVYACPDAAGLEPGETITLRVARVNPRAGSVRLQSVRGVAVDG